MYKLLPHATALIHGLSSLSDGDPNDDLIVTRLVRNLDGRYELTAAGAALRAGLSEIVDGAASPDDAEAELDKLFSDLESIGAGLDIPGADSLQLEHMSLCVRTADQDVLTPIGTWLRGVFRAGTAVEDVRVVPFEFTPSLALGFAG